MKQYTVTSSTELRLLCICHNWFTCGTNKQYEKLFYANEHGCPIEEIATIIWLCSDDKMPRRDILFHLKEARVKYWQPFFHIEHPDWTYRFWNRYGNSMECSFSAFCENLGKSKWEYEDIFKVEQNDQTIWYYTELTDNDS